MHAEPGAGTVLGGVAAGEALRRVGEWDVEPGSVIGDGDLGVGRVGGDADLDRAVAVRGRVVDEVADRLAHGVGIGLQDDGATGHGDRPARRQRARVGGDLLDDLQQVEWPGAEGVAALVEGGEDKQIVGQRGEVPDVADGRKDRLAGGGLGEGKFEAGPQTGQRSAQLMGGVGDERMLVAGGLGGAIEQVVEGAAEVGELVVGGGDGQAAPVDGEAHRRGTAAHLGDRAQGAAGHHIRTGGDE